MPMNARRCRNTRSLLAAAGGGSVELLEPRQMMAVDPITPNNPLWLSTWGTAVVDGVLNPSEWGSAKSIVRTQAYSDGSVTTRLLYNARGLYLSFDVKDAQLWSDGAGNGTGYRWQFADDDSVAILIDPNNSRDEFLQPGDRFFAFNLGAMRGAQTGGGVVSRWESSSGDGAGGLNFLSPFPENGGLNIRWATKVYGTVNDNRDVDVGWSSEVFIPWRALGRSVPASGDTLGLNFIVTSDQTGGTRDNTSRRTDPVVSRRFGPTILDDAIQGVESGAERTFGVISGPVSNAEVQFVDPRATTRPATIAGLTATGVTGYGARLEFLAPAGTQDGRGHVVKYEIRYSTRPIQSGADFAAATVLEQAWTPHLRGLAESLRFGGLSPSTAYFVAVRAVDAAGTPGEFTSVNFTTQSTAQDRSGGNRAIPSPSGNTFIRENGEALVLVGEDVSPLNLFIRTLYPGPITDSETGVTNNFNTNPGRDFDVDAYFAAAKAKGVTTLRVLLEWLDPIEASNNTLDGTYWLEYPARNFNPAMKQFLLNVLAKAEQYDIYVIFHPFNTFNYKEEFNESAWSTSAGGPLTTINNFFQNAQVLEQAKNRLRTIADWVAQSPYSYRTLGVKILNEVDAGWTLNPKGDNSPGRAAEMQDRAKFVVALSQDIKGYAPDLSTFVSVVGLSPRGPLHRALLLADGIDVLHPHFYTVGTREPINNPAADKTIFAAREYGRLASWWLTQRRDQRPVDNGEWGNIGEWWGPDGNGGTRPYYTGITPWANPVRPYSMATDDAIYRAVSWVTIVSGFAGSGLRLPGPEVRSTLTLAQISSGNYDAYLLTAGMRNIQQSVTRFVRDDSLGFDFAGYNGTPLTSRVSIAGGGAGGQTALVFGSSDAERGLVYVRQDKGRSTGPITGARVVIQGLLRGGVFDAQVWTGGPNARVLATLTGVSALRGTLSLALPSFSDDVVIKLVSRTVEAGGATAPGATITGASVNVTVWLDERGRPTLANGSERSDGPGQDLAGAARINATFKDVTGYAESNGRVTIIGLDTSNHLWQLTGRPGGVAWTARDLTATSNLAGIVGGLETVLVGSQRVIVGLNGVGTLVGVQRNTVLDPATGVVTERWIFQDFAARGATTRLRGEVRASITDGFLTVEAEAQDGTLVRLQRSLAQQRWTTTVLGAA